MIQVTISHGLGNCMTRVLQDGSKVRDVVGARDVQSGLCYNIDSVTAHINGAKVGMDDTLPPGVVNISLATKVAEKAIRKARRGCRRS